MVVEKEEWSIVVGGCWLAFKVFCLGRFIGLSVAASPFSATRTRRSVLFYPLLLNGDGSALFYLRRAFFSSSRSFTCQRTTDREVVLNLTEKYTRSFLISCNEDH